MAGGTAPAAAAAELVSQMTPEERLWCLDGDAPTWAGLGFMHRENGYHKAPFVAARLQRLGVPGIAFSDGPRGAVIGNATCFPVTMARAATWDPDLEERVGDAIGSELRALGANLTGAVCVNLLRHPAWGRAQETYGEDPHHVGEMGAALTRGLQRHVMACVKHFACNSMENARFSVDIEIDEVALHEIYLPHFRRIVDEGVATVMSAYNSVNGDWCGEHEYLLTEVLRGEWGFQGCVISDWILGLRDVAKSLRAGLDIEMPYRMVRAQHLAAALEREEATWDLVDAAATRVIALLLRFDGLLSEKVPSIDIVGSADHRNLAREVASRAVVLLRNQAVGGVPVLPLSPDVRAVGVFGRLAGTVNVGDGGSSDVWDLDCQSVLDGLRSGITGEVLYDDGRDVARSAALASDTEVCVVVVGYTYRDEGEYIGEAGSGLAHLLPPADEPEVVDAYEASLRNLHPVVTPERLSERPKGFSVGGDRSSLRLPDHDVELIRAVSSANPRTIVVIQAGSAVIISDWVDCVPAILQAWYGGCQAGPGLADVLAGRVNPSARLPFSVPLDESDLPPFDRDATTFTYGRWHGWWHLARIGREPAFPFGFGLSYTTFALTDVDLAVSPEQGTDWVTVTGTLMNTGSMDGADVVQVYADLPDADAPPRLVGFRRVEAAAGAKQAFEVRVPLSRLELRDTATHSWRRAAGLHRFRVGRYAGDPDGTVIDVDLAGSDPVRPDSLGAPLP